MSRVCLKSVLGAVAGLILCVGSAVAAAADLCAPSEATDPQPLHINGAKPFVYKTIGTTELRLHVFSSAARKPGDKSPAAVFFYGGGWVFGDIRRFQTQATHLALRGMVTVLVAYRDKCRNGHTTTIMDEVGDAKSAMRWVRGHADELGIDPSRIAAVGSSAGGQLAAATALVTDFDDPADPRIDARPNALILYNPGLELTSPAAIHLITQVLGDAIAPHLRALSPIDHLDRGLPPTLIFAGTADKTIPFASHQEFCRRARALKAQCELVLYPGAPHGFAEIWLGLEDPVTFPKTEFWAADTSRRTDAFLTKLGWLRRQ